MTLGPGLPPTEHVSVAMYMYPVNNLLSMKITR